MGMRIAIILAMMILAIANNSYAINITDKNALKGLQGIYVQVQMGGDSESVGISQKNIKNDSELKLRSLGIKVYDDTELANWENPVVLVR